MNRYGMRLGAARFVAGETLDQCLDVLADLSAKGLDANTTLLGEDAESRAETETVVAEFRTVLDRIGERGVRANLAVKLTHLGLLIDEELAFQNVAQLVDHAAERGNFVRIDMEHSSGGAEHAPREGGVPRVARQRVSEEARCRRRLSAPAGAGARRGCLRRDRDP